MNDELYLFLFSFGSYIFFSIVLIIGIINDINTNASISRFLSILLVGFVAMIMTGWILRFTYNNYRDSRVKK
jgi:uncharacterized membrane-anchored protein